MDAQIVIEDLQCHVRCGVTELERRNPQPVLITLEIRADATTPTTDSLADTIDYARVVQHTVKTCQDSSYQLLETLASSIIHGLFQEFPIAHLTIWTRKTSPPIQERTGSVGVRRSVTRDDIAFDRPGDSALPAPSPLLQNHWHRLPSGEILDVGCGSGRHTLFLANRGFNVVGVDRDAAALDSLREAARNLPAGAVTTHTIDLEASTTPPVDLGEHVYDGILVFYFLFRPLIPSLLRALKPGGVLMYETFLIDNHQRWDHPRNPDFCLEHNELLSWCRDFRILVYEEGPCRRDEERAPFTARLVAQKAQDKPG